MKISRIVSSIICVGLALVGSVAMAAESKNPTEQVVHDYIIKNPEVLIQSLQSYQEKQMDQARQSMVKTQETASKFSDPLFHQAGDPVGGNPNGKVTIVEFFDYQCPHCIDMVPVMDAILKSNSNVRVVYKEFPIRGPVSESAAKAALAAHQQGKYELFQRALMNAKKLPLTDDIIFTTAKSVGLNVDKLKADMKSPAVEQQIKNTYKLAQDLQLMGTPALFVAKSNVSPGGTADAVIFIPGQANQEQLQMVIDKVSK